jgi:hypothetical protein
MLAEKMISFGNDRINLYRIITKSSLDFKMTTTDCMYASSVLVGSKSKAFAMGLGEEGETGESSGFDKDVTVKRGSTSELNRKLQDSKQKMIRKSLSSATLKSATVCLKTRV